jgi:ABC-type sugar transport system, periplasmic component
MRYQKCSKVLVLVLVLAVGMSITFAGCGGSKSSTTDTQATTQQAATTQQETTVQSKDVTLTAWTGPDWKGVFSSDEANAQNGDWFNYVGKEFAKANPNDKITLNVQVVPYADMVQKLNIAVSSNTAPDIWSYSHFNIYSYISQGAIIPLDDVITPEAKSSISDALWNAATDNGKIYFYPFAALPTGLMVNKTLFEKAGALDKLPLNKEDRSWTNDEFKAALKAVTKNGTTSDYYGFGLYAGDRQFDTTNFGLLWSYGAKTFSSDYSKVALNDENGVKAMDFIQSLVKEKLTVPSPASITFNDTYNMFLQQKVAIIAGDPSFIPGITDGLKQKGMTPFDVELVMLPSSDGTPKTIDYIYALTAFKTGDDTRMEYAKKFIAFAAKPDYAKAFKVLGIPADNSISNLNDEKNEWKVTKNFVKYDSDLGSRVNGYSEIRNAFFPTLQAVLTGSKTSKQALDDFAKQSADIMAKYKK